ncbi:biotin--[acetyl-CoA-carboxylase] ligase [Fictibacillus gelatini]|uniref:biotin--[acetyl-CoA-carboxylase] ligase n=1 Tax=Fictibacillus gelatini TaxID=225985 RepID=UPI00041338EB|nr:biotin--[acetyl-CoA-carboxylase] ligase [Fictibacillus gelatini]
MRQQLLEMLMNHQGEFLSGQQISDQLNCSRTAIWKHIAELRKQGYQVEAAPKKGYRILSSPDAVTADEISIRLKTEKFGRQIVSKESVSSTQEIAHKLSHEKCEEGTLVVADEQTGARGRMGRPWQSPKGSGIWMSLILRPEIPLQRAPQLTLLTAVAVVKAIHKVTGLNAEIKWPNDILINGKKVVGILTELQAEADRINSVIIGIGMNVNLSSDELPDEIRGIATSLQIETGQAIRRADLIAAVMKEMELLYKQYLQEGFHLIKLLWESYALSLGKRIKVRTISGEFEGFAKGITDEGVLLLEDDENQIHQIYSADIEIPRS